MTKEAIREKITAAPFRPFAVRLTDGRKFDVPGPDFASVSPNGRLFSVWTHSGNAQSRLDVALIAEIEQQETR